MPGRRPSVLEVVPAPGVVSKLAVCVVPSARERYQSIRGLIECQIECQNMCATLPYMDGLGMAMSHQERGVVD